MKKIALILLTFLSFAAFSQKVGVKGGLNLGKERSSGNGISIISDNRTSFNAGIYSEFSASEELFFAPELVYSQDGGEVSAAGVSASDRLNYLSLPLLLKYYISDHLVYIVARRLFFN